MNAIVLPLVRKIDGPEEYPFSRAKFQVGEQWYITMGNQGPVLIPALLSIDFNEETHMIIAHRFYRCIECRILFSAYHVEGYIHECCEVQ